MAMLYELTGAYAALMARLEDCETEREAFEVTEAMNDVDEAISEKCEAYARILRNLESESASCEVEIKRLQARKKTADNTADRMLQHLHYAMEIAGATEIRTSIGKFRIAKNPWSVAILDESKIPEEFLIPQPPKVDKTAIMQRFRESGEIIDGCDMVQREGVRFR